MKVHQALANTLAAHDVSVMFGLMGYTNMMYMTDYIASGHGQVIGAVHEAGAVSMADGYHHISGKVGVATVTRGPGFTNTLTALTGAVRNRSRLLVLTSDAGSESTHFQSIDTAAVVAPTGAGYERIYRPDTLVRDVNRAFHRIAGEQRPIVLNVPFDFLMAEAGDDQRAVSRPGLEGRIGFDPVMLDNALGLVASAKRPLILAGRGAVESDAREELIKLAEILGAPLATTLLAKDFFRGHPLNVGICGNLSSDIGSTVISEADSIVAFGASLNLFTALRGDIFKGKRIVQCDTDPARFGTYTPVDEAVVGDVRVVAAAMTSHLEEADLKHGSWAKKFEPALASASPSEEFVDQSNDETVDVRAAMIRLDEVLPYERTIVSDVGRFTTAAWRYLHVSAPKRFSHSGAFGSIGLGMATAIGAAIADPGRPTVALAGDGGFMMHLGEFSTAVRYAVPMLVIVLNDGSYGSEYHALKEHGVDPAYSLNQWPDLAPVAESLGGRGMTIRSVKELDILHDIFTGLRGPLLLDVKLDPAVDIRD